MRSVLRVLIPAFLLTLSVAMAEETRDYYVESRAVGARADLDIPQQVATDHGWTSRVLRRYSQGEGWQYVLVVEGFADATAAAQAADVITAASSIELDLYRREGRSAVLLSAGENTGQLERQDLQRGAVSKDIPSSELVLERAVKALGGQEAGLARIESLPTIHFRFERTIYGPDGVTVAMHDFVRAPEGQRLDIRILSGPGVGSSTILAGDRAWLVTDTETVTRDAGRAREVLAEFGPEHLLSYPLRFAALVAADPVHGRLVTTDIVKESGRSTYVLENAGPEGGGELSIRIDGQDWRPIEVASASDAGLVRVQFSDWRVLDIGIVVPFELSMERDGQQLEKIRVQELSAPGTWPASSFAPEAAKAPSP